MVETAIPEKITADFCITLRYNARVNTTPAGKYRLELTQAKRALTELYVNGKNAGEHPWGPYCWDLELPARGVGIGY